MSAEFSTPVPNPALTDPALTRPDWTTGVRRDTGLLWLDKNENHDPQLLELTTRVLRSLDPEFIYTYPEMAPLYQKLAASVGVGPEHLLMTAGSDGAIRAVFEAYVQPGDLVLHTVPTFAMYQVYGQMYGARRLPMAYQPSATGPRLDADEVIATIAAHRPRLVCLPNPDSPTGTVFAPADLRRIVEAAGAADVVMLVDEAYFPFYDQTTLPWVLEYPHLIVARTFAKAWGLAGLRVGFLAAHPAVARILHLVRPMYEVNTVGAAMVERMLDHSAEIDASVARLNASKTTFLAAMSALGFRVLRGHGNFLHVAFGELAPPMHTALKGIVLYRPDFNEACLKGFSRFSVASEDQWAPVLTAIRAVAERAGVTESRV